MKIMLAPNNCRGRLERDHHFLCLKAADTCQTVVKHTASMYRLQLHTGSKKAYWEADEIANSNLVNSWKFGGVAWGRISVGV